MKQNSNNNKTAGELQKDLSSYSLNCSLDQNLEVFREIFRDDDTFSIRLFKNELDESLKFCLLFIDGMVNNELINEDIIKPAIKADIEDTSDDLLQIIKDTVIAANDVELTEDVAKLTDAIIRGDTVFMADNVSGGLIISTKEPKTRSIEEPTSERAVLGPREGFVEDLMLNLSLIRRKLATPDLKFRFIKLGTQSRTNVCICYLDSTVNKKILQEVYKRIGEINIDGILDSEYIKDYIRDNPFSPFLTTGSTERPDVVAANILEGRIAILVDGTPVAVTVPYVFIENFQSNEDYYLSFLLASFNRLLRIAGFWISISVPGVYTALVTYHQEAIPTPLLLSISAARQGVPFPTIVEVILLSIVFEMIRDAGVRMPSNLGQALSIVGALVLGSAAVEAKIVSAPIVIIVSVSAITGFMVPKLMIAIVCYRPLLLLLSAFLGLYGYVFGIMGILLHLCSISSFGVPYMLQITNLTAYEMKDTAIRMPQWFIKYRPKIISLNRVREGRGGSKPWSGKRQR